MMVLLTTFLAMIDLALVAIGIKREKNSCKKSLSLERNSDLLRKVPAEPVGADTKEGADRDVNLQVIMGPVAGGEGAKGQVN